MVYLHCNSLLGVLEFQHMRHLGWTAGRAFLHIWEEAKEGWRERAGGVVLTEGFSSTPSEISAYWFKTLFCLKKMPLHK